MNSTESLPVSSNSHGLSSKMNILVVRHDKLGDFITALPSLYIIKKHLPNCHLSVFIAPLNESIALNCDFIDEVIIDRGQSISALAALFKQRNFQLSITLFSNTRLALAQFLARIPQRIAPATKIAQIFYNRRILQQRSKVKMAEFEYNIDLVKAALPGIDISYPQPLLTFQQPEIRNKFQLFCAQHNLKKRVVAFHPGFGGSSDANWTIQEYVELAGALESNDQIAILFTFGPGDEQFFEAFKNCKGDLRAESYFSNESVFEFGKLISSFELFISTSTGTFHLASAVGTKTMTFFADSLFASAKRWKGVGNESLQHNYMIPKDKTARDALFRQVKTDLIGLV